MIEEQEKKNYKSAFYKKNTADSQNLGDWNRQSNRQEKINIEKRSEGVRDIKVKKENEWRHGRKNKMLSNRKWQVGNKEIHKMKQ